VLVEMPGYDALRDRPQPPLLPLALRHERSIFEIVREQDILLHHPYDSFDPVLELIEAAAADPGVLAIKQTLYRTGGGGSRVPGALIRAAEHGKQVTALIELTARFDEERNISWARHLEEAGAHVLYGLVGLKAHAKVALVVRREPDGIRRYVHLGTGNYNERTARAYSDFGLLTAVPEFGSDISGFFNAVTGYSEPPEFARVVMAPFGLRQRLVSLIRREADRARAGQPGRILAKLNSLVDPQIILELCAAGTAGVAVDLIVRGICCLRPGVPGVSDNVRVVSILDRYLEHGRAHVFRNGGDPEVYLSSADWMPRNLDRRVELMFPVLDPAARDRVVDALETQLADNQKARVLRSDGRYRRVSAARVEPVRAQQVLYRRLLDLEERAGGAADSRITPLEGSKPHP
jgi:polyphosphate kinase